MQDTISKEHQKCFPFKTEQILQLSQIENEIVDLVDLCGDTQASNSNKFVEICECKLYSK